MTDARLQRTIPAPPARVFRAWLDPGLLARWMTPGESFEVVKAEVDPRPGGHFRVFHADDGGFEATFVEVDEPSRLALEWSFVGPRRLAGPHFPSLLTVVLEPVGDGQTLLTLVHTRLDDLAAAMPPVASQVSEGWSHALDQLPGALS